MLDGLSRRNQACVKSWLALKIVEYFFTFSNYTFDRLAGFALCTLAENLENLLETLHVDFCLVPVLLESSL